MRRTAGWAGWALVFLSGCADEAPAPAVPTQSLPLPTSVAAPSPAVTLEGDTPAPTWGVGDWWRWLVETPLHLPIEVTTVVAAADNATYHVAATSEEAGIEALTFHVPMQGLVDRGTFAWEVHDEAARWLDFPLRDGKAWQGSWEGAGVSFLATRLDHEAADEARYQVEGLYADGSLAVRFVYWTGARTFEYMAAHYGNQEPFVVATLLDHGAFHRGSVIVFTADDVHKGGSAGLVPSGMPPNPPPSPQTFPLTAGFDRLVIACYLGGAEGAYRIVFRSPQDAPPVCELDNTGGSTTEVARVLTVDPVQGDWIVAYMPAGAGYVYAEVLGVHADRVDMA